MGEDKTVKLLKTLERKTVNMLYWCPKGQFIVLAGLRAFNGALEFWNVNDMEMMANGEHFMCTDVEWDPTGRYVATSVSAWRHQMENGYRIWDFRGKMLYDEQKERFYLFLWRPRPPTLLSKDKMKDIRKRLKEYSVEFNKQDDQKDNKATRLAQERLRRLMEEWTAFRSEGIARHKSEHDTRTDIRGFSSDDEDQEEIVEEWVEEVIEETK